MKQMKQLILLLAIVFGLTSCQKEDFSPTYKGLVTPDTTGVAFPDSAANVTLETYELWQADDCTCYRFIEQVPHAGWNQVVRCNGDTTWFSSSLLSLANGTFMYEHELIDSYGYICNSYYPPLFQ